MRILATISVLPILALAQQQNSFVLQAQAWLEKAQEYVKSATSVALGTGAAHIADHSVSRLTWENWRSTLMHTGASRQSTLPEPWMVYVTGGNKTCFGNCAPIDRKWNESVALFQVDPNAPKLAVLDCEEEVLLCGAWAAETATIWYFLIPKPTPDQSKAPTAITIHHLFENATTDDIINIHNNKEYLSTSQYTGRMHPFDGWVARYGLTTPLTYVLWGLSKIPSWAFMIGISLWSRYFVSRRMPRDAPRQNAAAAPVAAPAAAS